MARADFYLIDKPRFREQPLLLVCELVRRAYAQRQPVLVLVRDLDEAEALDELLWSFDEEAFIPHQIAGDDDDGETAVLIVPPGVQTPDRTLVVNLRDEPCQRDCQRLLEVVPADPDARAGSRARWRAYQQRGLALAKHDR